MMNGHRRISRLVLPTERSPSEKRAPHVVPMVMTIVPIDIKLWAGLIDYPNITMGFISH